MKKAILLLPAIVQMAFAQPINWPGGKLETSGTHLRLEEKKDQRLDSIVDPKHSKTVFLYDSSHNTGIIEYGWEATTGTWKKLLSSTQSFNENGKITSFISDMLYLNSNTYEGQYKQQYLYDSVGNLQYGSMATWDFDTKQWQNTAQFSYPSYNSSGYPTLRILNVWDKNSQKWVAESKTHFAYDAAGRDTANLSISWNKEAQLWKSTKETNLYDEKGNLLQFASRSWEKDSAVLTEGTTLEQTYDAWGNNVTQYAQVWNPTTQVWQNNMKQESIYQGEKKLSSSITWNWNETTKQWDYSYKQEKTYAHLHSSTLVVYMRRNDQWVPNLKSEMTEDAKGNIVSQSNYQMDLSSNLWDGTTKATYSLDTDTYNHEILMPYAGYSNDWNKMLERKMYTWSNKEWQESSSETFHYSPLVITGLPNTLEIASPIFFPNPAIDHIRLINIPTEASCTLFDVQGKENECHISPNGYIEVKHLEAGVYQLRISNALGKTFYKLLKQ